MTPVHTDGTRTWRLERRRARTLPPRAWIATRTGALCETGAGLHLTRA